MNKTPAFVLAFVMSGLAAPRAFAECWNASSDSEAFFDRAAVSEVRTCLLKGAEPNQQDSSGFFPLHRLALAGSINNAAPAIVRVLLEAGADPHLTMNGYTAAVVAKGTWGSDSPIALAFKSPAAASGSSAAPLYGAIAVAELLYMEAGQHYRTPSVIALNFSSIDAAIRRAKSDCDRDFARARAYDEYNECAVYRVFSTSIRDHSYYDADRNGVADTRKTPGRCGVAMSNTVRFQGGSYRPFWASGAGDTKASAMRNAMAHCRDNWGADCDGMEVRSFACNDH